MFFRFGSAIALVVLVSLVGIAFEKRNLSYRRELSRQHYRLDVLLETHSRLRLKSQQLGAPVRLIDSMENGELELEEPDEPVDSAPRRIPLLRWNQPSHPPE